MPISIGFRIGCLAWWSKLGERPSQNIVCSRAAFAVVGALRLPTCLPMPSDPGSWSVKPRVTS